MKNIYEHYKSQGPFVLNIYKRLLVYKKFIIHPLCSNILSFLRPHNFSDDEQCMYIMFYMLRYTVIYKHRMFMFTSLALYIVRTLTTATKIANKISINFLYPTHIYLSKHKHDGHICYVVLRCIIFHFWKLIMFYRKTRRSTKIHSFLITKGPIVLKIDCQLNTFILPLNVKINYKI